MSLREVTIVSKRCEKKRRSYINSYIANVKCTNVPSAVKYKGNII